MLDKFGLLKKNAVYSQYLVIFVPKGLKNNRMRLLMMAHMVPVLSIVSWPKIVPMPYYTFSFPAESCLGIAQEGKMFSGYEAWACLILY